MTNLCYIIKLLQLVPRLFYLHTLCYFINSCSLIKLSSSNQSFVIFSTVSYLLPTYATYAPHKCTCTTHQTTQPSLSSYRAHALCAKTTFQLNKRLWSSCHSYIGGSSHGWGVFSKNKRYSSLAVCFCYSCGLAFIVVRFYTADDLVRSSIDRITSSAVKGCGTP